MPSKYEAFGRVTVEYMSRRLAVLASNSGANKEIVKDGETGLLFDSSNFIDLACGMQKMIENKLLIMKMGDNGYKIALEQFSSELNARKFSILYRRILCGSKKMNDN